WRFRRRPSPTTVTTTAAGSATAARSSTTTTRVTAARWSTTTTRGTAESSSELGKTMVAQRIVTEDRCGVGYPGTREVARVTDEPAIIRTRDTAPPTFLWRANSRPVPGDPRPAETERGAPARGGRKTQEPFARHRTRGSSKAPEFSEARAV